MTIETVRGGGLVIFLLSQLESIEQLSRSRWATSKRYETDSKLSKECIPRFSERFCKIMQTNPRMLCLDESLNVVDFSELQKNIMQIEKIEKTDDSKLKQLQKECETADDPIKSSLSKLPCTLDQCKCLIDILDLFAGKIPQEPKTTVEASEEQENAEETNEDDEKVVNTASKSKEELLEERKLEMIKKHNVKLYNDIMNQMQPDTKEEEVRPVNLFPENKQVFVKAARGRGKSALMGLAVAAAISQRATNVLIFAPKVQNVQTLFQFAETGLKQLGYAQTNEYRLMKDGDKGLSNVIGIDVFKTHRQSVRFISPEVLAVSQEDPNTSLLNMADLIIIDEAAAMPIDLLRHVLHSKTFALISSTVHGYEGSGRSLQVKVINQLQKSQQEGKQLIQMNLDTPIRYATNDAIERWLYDLLLLDCERFLEEHRADFPMAAPLPDDCQLYMLSRDCLFGGLQGSESFLKLVWSIFATSHYKNQPNDLMLVSDNPTHRLFALFGPITDKRHLPMPLAIIHVALEGAMDAGEVEKKLHINRREEGNMVPWVLSQEYLSPAFGELTGARTVRIAANPYFARQGYGSKALQQLKAFVSGSLQTAKTTRVDRDMAGYAGQLAPMLMKLSQLTPEPVHYMSVAFGLTQQLYTFWSRNGYKMVHLRHKPSQDTCEHSCVMIQPLTNEGTAPIKEFGEAFKARFCGLLDCSFKELPVLLAQRVLLQDAGEQTEHPRKFSQIQLRRLTAYSRRALDFASIMDLVRDVTLWFLVEGNQSLLNSVQQRVLIAIGLQRKTFQQAGQELGTDADQAQAIFSKAVEVAVREQTRYNDVK